MNSLRSLTLAASLLLVTATAFAEPESKRPNVLLVVADDLGFSDLGCYGSEIATPNLDRLAANGVRLTQFYTTARCCPSRACLLTGQYPHAVGLGHMTKDLGPEHPGYRGRVSPRAATIAEILGRGGYRSFLAGKWHLGTDDPTRHGFEEFYGTLVSAKTFWDPDHFTRLPKDRPRREYEPDEFYATDAVTDHALDFLSLARDTPDRPWFLYLAYNAPHFPLQAPPESIAKYEDRYHVGWDVIREERLARMKTLGIVPKETELSPRSRFFDWGETQPGTNPAWDSLPKDRRTDLARRMAIYAAMVDRLDEQFGRVLDDLRKHDEWENTLILFTSDNGACAEWDPLGFDGKSGPTNVLHTGDALAGMGRPGTFHSVGSGWANASNTPWRLYKHYNHEGGLSVPCIAHWPAGIDHEPAIDATPTHLVDLLPTLVEATGVEPSKRIGERTPPTPAGRSLLPVLRGEPTESRPLFFEHEGHRAVRHGGWKLVALRGEPWELYNVADDRTETHDVAKEQPEVVERLSAAWKKWARSKHVTPLPTDYGVEYVPPLPN